MNTFSSLLYASARPPVTRATVSDFGLQLLVEDIRVTFVAMHQVWATSAMPYPQFNSSAQVALLRSSYKQALVAVQLYVLF